jgi:hypothetical protein
VDSLDERWYRRTAIVVGILGLDLGTVTPDEAASSTPKCNHSFGYTRVVVAPPVYEQTWSTSTTSRYSATSSLMSASTITARTEGLVQERPAERR